MSNVGAYPIDPSTPVGALRVLVGDTSGEELPGGVAEYRVWSDQALQAALTIAGSPYRAAGDLYTGIAAFYAQKGRQVRTDDLQLNTSGRSGAILDIAKQFYAQASEAAAAENSDFFDIVQIGGGDLTGTPWATCETWSPE